MKCLVDAWNKNEQFIFKWLVKQTKDSQQANDIMQDVFLNAMKNTDRFCGLDDAKSWLFKMVKNRYIDILRQQVLMEDIDAIKDEIHHEEAELQPIQQMKSCIPVILQKLNDEQSDIIEQCDLLGLSQQQYADLNGLSLSAVKSRLLRARKQLKIMLVQHCNVEQQHGVVCSFKGKHSVQ